MNQHEIEWTIGPQETDICIVFKVVNYPYAGHFDHVTGSAEPPSGYEFDEVRATVIETREEISKEHPLRRILDDHWNDDEYLYEQMCRILEGAEDR